MKKTALLALFIGLIPILAVAQSGAISGIVSIQDTGEPLALAQVEVVGAAIGSTTDFNGEYLIKNIPTGSYKLRASYLGYKTVTASVIVTPGAIEKVDFSLATDIISIEEITVVASRAKKRETPVAFTDVPKADIEAQLGSRDVPMVLNTTPGVYATLQGGAAGDSRINVRGFDQTNFAIMINGVPVNDMENGWVYWSNWDGLGDVTSSVQVQRGMGASNLAISSVGGTVNIITDAASFSRGGSFKQEVGNDGFMKTTVSANSGLINDKYAASAAFVRKTGDGFAEKTWTDAYAYFLGLSYLPLEDHKFDFYAVGAPQQHGQRSYKQNIYKFDSQYAYSLGVDTTGLTGNYGIDYNPNWGPIAGASSEDLTEYYNGEEHDPHSTNYINERTNYFHKPQFNLNWYWTINDRMKLTNVVYLSLGKGGGSGRTGNNPGTQPNGLINWTAAYGWNTNNIDPAYSTTLNRAKTALYNSVNQHNWYGWIGSLKYNLNEQMDLTVGTDLRMYKGMHWREVRSLIGGDYFINMDNDNLDYTANPQLAMQGLGDEIFYNYDGFTRWLGGFATLDYKKDKLAGFANFALSRTSYKCQNYFLVGEPEDDWQDFFGFGLKGGLNYNLNDWWNVYGNAGHMSKAPNMDGVYVDNRYSLNKYDDPKNEKIYSADLGLGFSNKQHTLYLDANYYYTLWEDKTWGADTHVDSGWVGGVWQEIDSTYYYALQGIDALHQGLEITATARLNKWLECSGMASLANWRWLNNVTATFSPDENPDAIDTTQVYLEDIRVGNAPQTTLSLSATVFPLKGAYASVVFTRYADNYTAFNPSSRTDEDALGVQPWMIPAYDLVDLHLGYTIPDNLPTIDFQVFAHIFNVFDAQYLSDASETSATYSTADYTAATAEVFMGPSRTWNLGFKVTM